MYPWSDVINDVYGELKRSVVQHPHYPDDELRRAAITCEEAGEVIQAALDLTRVPDRGVREDLLLERLYDECRQCAAMAVKHMLALRGVDVDEYFRVPQQTSIDWSSRREER